MGNALEKGRAAYRKALDAALLIQTGKERARGRSTRVTRAIQLERSQLLHHVGVIPPRPSPAMISNSSCSTSDRRRERPRRNPTTEDTELKRTKVAKRHRRLEGNEEERLLSAAHPRR